MTDIYMKLAEYAATAPASEFNAFLAHLEDCCVNGELLEDDFNTLLKSLKDARGAMEKIQYGTYTVNIENLFLGRIDNAPAVTCLMRVLSGDHAGDLIAMNLPAKNGFQVHTVNVFLRDLCRKMDNPPEIKFKNFSQYGNLIMWILEMVSDRYAYAMRFYDCNGSDACEVEGISLCR